MQLQYEHIILYALVFVTSFGLNAELIHDQESPHRATCGVR